MGIVAGSERWILEAALNVDHQQRTLPDHASDPTVGRGSCRRRSRARARGARRVRAWRYGESASGLLLADVVADAQPGRRAGLPPQPFTTCVGGTTRSA